MQKLKDRIEQKKDEDIKRELRKDNIVYDIMQYIFIILFCRFSNMSSEVSERPYKCDCGESFNTQEELDQHRKLKADNSGSNLK
jgi:predicted SprT family Zn-dependent metalloprotease